MQRGVVISQTLDNMLNNGAGFRTESYSGSGVRRAEDVLRYELSMGNTDFVRFCQTNHRILLDICPSDEFFDSIEGLSIEEQDEARNAEMSELCQENAPYIVEKVLEFVCELLGSNNKNELDALWLTDYDSVVKRYGADLDDIDEYNFASGRFVVISDLGEDGALFVL